MQRRGRRLSPCRDKPGGGQMSSVLRLASTGVNTESLVEHMNWEEKGLLALLPAPAVPGRVPTRPSARGRPTAPSAAPRGDRASWSLLLPSAPRAALLEEMSLISRN